MRKKTFDEVLAEADELGLLADMKAVPSISGPSDRIRQKFEEINSFIDRFGRLPGKAVEGNRISPTEKTLQFSLSKILGDRGIADQLKPFDRHNVLLVNAKEQSLPRSIDEIISHGDPLLTTASDEIFGTNPGVSSKASPDRKSERRPCKEFASFKPLFDECVADLLSGRRQSRPFANEQEIGAGDFFILNGQMIYVAAVTDRHIRNGKPNARLHLIFDNGTEGDNLLRSLSAELYKDFKGRRITTPTTQAGPLFDKRAANDSDATIVPRGEIYVARSLSTRPEIVAINEHLVKIGFTTGTTEARIASAKDDPTFLFAEVRPVKIFEVYDMDTVLFENLIHRFFIEARLNIEIIDRFGKPVRPREWFLLPLATVEEAVRRLVDGSIIRYRYDHQLGTLSTIS
jgi:T5orf172 domain